MRGIAQFLSVSERASTWPPPALDPAGPFAAPLSEISWVVFVGGGAILVLVLALLGLALTNPPRWLGGKRVVLLLGFAFPVIVLSGALIYGLTTTARLSDPPAANELTIRVVGEMWWWRVYYLDGDDISFETANEIRIPAGRPVTFELESADVIHSFWVPRLGAKLDMIPGRRNILRLQADRPGLYQGHCTEFCGLAHALMAFEVIAVAPAEFESWRALQTAPASVQQTRGGDLFDDAGCSACHSVRGTSAAGRAGPDLTHFASRRRLGAGVLANDSETLRRWIEDADALKPGVRMPSYETLPADDQDAIALYLEGLQ